MYKWATLNITKANHQSGQVAVVILVMMVVILTIGLSVAARTTQDLILSRQSSDSTRAFDAAETGVDEGLAQLQNGLNTGGQLPSSGNLTINQSDVNYQIGQGNFLDTRIFQGNAVAVNIVDPKTTPNGLGSLAGAPALHLEWSAKATDGSCTGSTNKPASLLLSIYNNAGGVTTVRNLGMAGCTNRGDNFTATGGTPDPKFNYRYDLPLSLGDLFVRIHPIYNDTELTATGINITLPTQYYTVNSQAKNQTGTETRKIQVNRTLPTAPSVMDYALISGGTLVQ